MTVHSIVFCVLPWPCAAVVAAHVASVDRGSSQRMGPPEVSVSHNKLCHGSPCACAESVENLPYPAGRRKEKAVGEIQVKGGGEEGI